MKKSFNIKGAKEGNERDFGELAESVRNTFVMLVERNFQAFKLSFEKEDYKSQFLSEVWRLLESYDEDRGCSFNTYFYNNIQWGLSNRKHLLKSGKFDMPFSGLNIEDAEALHYFEQNSRCTEVDFGHNIDLSFILERTGKMPEKEKFFIENILQGSKIREVVESMATKYGVSHQWCYQIGHTAVSKLKKYVKNK